MDDMDSFTAKSAGLLKILAVNIPPTPPIPGIGVEPPVPVEPVEDLISEVETDDHLKGRMVRAPAAKQIPVRSKR